MNKQRVITAEILQKHKAVFTAWGEHAFQLKSHFNFEQIYVVDNGKCFSRRGCEENVKRNIYKYNFHDLV